MARERLAKITREVAEQEGFEFQSMPQELDKYYGELVPENADDCVDDRPPKDEAVAYMGMQLPGATFGKIDSFRKVAGVDEKRGREVISDLYTTKGYGIGGHIDDHHGEITDPVELAEYKDGCGKLRVLSGGKVEVYKDLGVTQDVAYDRIDWVRENGQVITLTDVHGAIGAVANLVEGTTLNTREAAKAAKKMFDGDFEEAHRRSLELHDMLSVQDAAEIKGMDRDEFAESMTRAEITDYLQTLRALNYDGPLWIRE